MALRDFFSSQVRELLSEDKWLVAEDCYDSGQNLVFETNFALASGAMGSRAAHEEGFVQNTLPACYVHGVFDRSEAFQRELCNTPDWAKLKIYYEREPVSPGVGEVEGYLRVLDMRRGLVAKRYIHLAGDGRRTRVELLKFLSRAHPRCGLLRLLLTPLNYGGLFELENVIDGTVTNFMDFPRFRVKHLAIDKVSALRGGEGCYIGSHTRDLGLPVGTSACVRVLDENGEDALRSRAFRPYGEVACEFFDANIPQEHTLCVEKYAAVCTGRDFDDVEEAARQELAVVAERGFGRELADHVAAYDALWGMADVELVGDDALQQALRFNIFHLMSTPSPIDRRVGIGAKLMHGEEYGGHSFWDTELFIRPFFDYVFPHIARNLAGYRYLLLDKARENARKNGYLGAKFPWESADTGDEECPDWTIEPDGSCYRCYVAQYEHHVTAAVAFGAVRYYQVTGDEDYFDTEGLELLAETARFWASRLERDPASGQYGITGVTGPDEWHEPVDNNAYTNHLACWNILTALRYLRHYKATKPTVYARVCGAIALGEDEMAEWNAKAEAVRLVRSGLIEQFDGYFKLRDAVIDRWDDNQMPLLPQSLRGVPREECCILKQADVVMLLFLLEQDFDVATRRENFDYYEARTLHRSSLSPGIHCIVGLRCGEEKRAYAYLERSAYVDLRNNQGNTREGIHAAAAGATWQSVVLGYCGMSVGADGVLEFAPNLPRNWEHLRFAIRRGDAVLRIQVSQGDIIARQQGGESPLPYRLNGQTRQAETTLGKVAIKRREFSEYNP